MTESVLQDTEDADIELQDSGPKVAAPDDCFRLPDTDKALKAVDPSTTRFCFTSAFPSSNRSALKVLAPCTASVDPMFNVEDKVRTSIVAPP